jgi:hypothetical protein
MTETTLYSVRMPVELLDAVREAARLRGSTPGRFVLTAIHRALEERKPPKYALHRLREARRSGPGALAMKPADDPNKIVIELAPTALPPDPFKNLVINPPAKPELRKAT